jgi:hypothetical protein
MQLPNGFDRILLEPRRLLILLRRIVIFRGLAILLRRILDFLRTLHLAGCSFGMVLARFFFIPDAFSSSSAGSPTSSAG